MQIALLSDIHANREAFEAVLSAARAEGAEKLVLLGDIVGYGADPEWCIDRAAALVAQGAIVLRGNHDQAVGDMSVSLNGMARLSLQWTRNQLDDRARSFLAALPLEAHLGNLLFVHASAEKPARWKYVLGVREAAAHLAACDTGISFCGHVHVPALYCTTPVNKVIGFPPGDQVPIPLSDQRQWLAVMGSVGQPRDGNPLAAFGLFDTERHELRFMRVPYDIETAATKILAAGLPAYLADRLRKGI
jgi:Predicted phosphoesterase